MHLDPPAQQQTTPDRQQTGEEGQRTGLRQQERPCDTAGDPDQEEHHPVKLAEDLAYRHLWPIRRWKPATARPLWLDWLILFRLIFLEWCLGRHDSSKIKTSSIGCWITIHHYS